MASLPIFIFGGLNDKNQPTGPSIALRAAAKPTLDHCLGNGVDAAPPSFPAPTAAEIRAGQQQERDGALASTLDDVAAAGARLF